MLLGVSNQDEQNEADLSAIATDDGAGSNIPHGDALVRLANAVLGTDEAELAAARTALIDAVGMAGLVDAAAVIGAFTMQNRVADAIGLPLDTPIELATRSMRASLGYDQFGAAAYTARGGWGRALLAWLLQPITPLLFRILGHINRRRQGASHPAK